MKKMFFNKRLINKKLEMLTQYLKELEPIVKCSFNEFLGDYFKLHTAERLIQLLVDTAYDINAYLLGEAGRRLPDDYYSSFARLPEIKALPRKFSIYIAGSAGMRNRLVHEYDEVDLARVFKNLPFLVKNYKKYVILINDYLTR